jgi:hypothetical protein
MRAVRWSKIPTQRSDLSPTHDGGQTRRWRLVMPLLAIQTMRWNSPSPWPQGCGRPLVLPTNSGELSGVGASLRRQGRRRSCVRRRPIGTSIGLAFGEVYQQGHAILATLDEQRTAGDPAVDRQAATGIELAVTPTTCKYCPGLLVWAREEAGKPLPLDPPPFPALLIAANQRWLPDPNVPGDNRPPRMHRVHDQTEGYAYRRHNCPGR